VATISLLEEFPDEEGELTAPPAEAVGEGAAATAALVVGGRREHMGAAQAVTAFKRRIEVNMCNML
jgi:hypothetical protein